jgi:hypothetical protein
VRLERQVNFRARFEMFIKTMRDFESVDELLRQSPPVGKQRADYFLWDRSIIVEQKALVVDPADKPQQFVKRLLEQGRIRPFRNSTTRAIFDSLPDGKKLEHRMYLGMTRGLEKDIATADKQTRDTREIFEIPDAIGVLLILNESAPSLPPALIRYRLDLSYGDMTHGRPRYPQNDGVIVISDVHALIASDGCGMPCIALPTVHGKDPERFLMFADTLVEGWSAFNNLPIARQRLEDIHDCVNRMLVGSSVRRGSTKR